MSRWASLRTAELSDFWSASLPPMISKRSPAMLVFSHCLSQADVGAAAAAGTAAAAANAAAMTMSLLIVRPPGSKIHRNPVSAIAFP
jgi:hypothetical protein